MAEKPQFDPQAFKDFERTGWQGVAGDYGDSFAVFTNQAVPHLLEATGVAPGARVLDVACGPGFATAAAQSRGAEATGVDFAENMLAEARRVNPGPDYRFGDAENLSFAEDTFDAVLCNFGILHFPFPERAIGEAFRVLKRGGRFAFTDWCGPEESPYFSLLLGAMQAHGDMTVPLPTGPPMFRFSRVEEAKKVLVAAGFAEPNAQVLPITSKWTKAAEVMGVFFSGTVRMGTLLRAQTADALEKIDREMREKALEFKSGEEYRIPIPALMGSAHKP